MHCLRLISDHRTSLYLSIPSKLRLSDHGTDMADSFAFALLWWACNDHKGRVVYSVFFHAYFLEYGDM